ncbi:MAG: flagellar export protein FliJ [Pseudomonadota bacterium]|nr:flagellar export protein FliJ [Pseudomonadota bacterium]
MPASATTDWQRLCGLARERRDACAQRLGETNAGARAAQEKLEMLLAYQRDYNGRMSDAGAGGIAAERLQNFRRFMQQLERAVEQQRAVAKLAQDRVDDAQLALRVAQRSVESFAVLVDRHRAATAVRERRDEQKQQDEYATRPLPRFLSGAN